MAAVGAAQAQEAVREDAALEEGVELVLHELRQVGAGSGFGLGKEGGGVLLHQPVQRGLLGAVALVVDRGAIGRPAGLLKREFHALLASSRRPQAGLSSLDSSPALAFAVAWLGPSELLGAAQSIVLDRVQDAGNVGTILRSAAAFGFSQVLALKGSAGLWSPKVLRAAMGAHFALHLVEGVDEAVLVGLRLPLLAADPHAVTALHERELPWPCAWLFGREGHGVSGSLLSRCTHALRIPQPGGEESLNVAAAAAVCMYESMRQRLPE